MLDASFIQSLRQSNISADGEKTKERFERLWRAASPEDKRAIEELAGIMRASVRRVYDSGSISAKLATAAAQVLNVNPYYLTGEAEEQGESSDKILRTFLVKLGYENQLAQYDAETQPKKPSRGRRPKANPAVITNPPMEASPINVPTLEAPVAPAASAIEQEPEQATPETEEEPIASAVSSIFDEYNEDDLLLLLRSIKLRAKAGVPSAIKQAEELRRIMLS